MTSGRGRVLCTAIGVGVGVASSVAAVIALAWVRLRRCGHSPALSAQQQQPQEMEWDNSTFNITVNPLDCDVRFHYYTGCRGEVFRL